MKKVCFFDARPNENFHGYRLESFKPLSYFSGRKNGGLRAFISHGINGIDKKKMLLSVAGIDQLYRERDPEYMKMVGDFVDRFRDYDLIIMSTYNFIHPEILYREMKKPVKILGFGDDPFSTYTRGLPYLWAFDGAFYISPGYIDELEFEAAILRWGIKKVKWFPLSSISIADKPEVRENFFRDRKNELCYVGGHYTGKIDRLIQMKKHFKNRLKVHGRWPLHGYNGFLRVLGGATVFPYRVKSLSAQERIELYCSTKICFNLHLSGNRSETGNMRMYETPAYGMMLLCDKGAADSHSRIFTPDREAVYYDSIPDAIEKAEYYLNHDEERAKIAENGFNRYWQDYEYEKNLLDFLNWAMSVKS